MNNQNYAKKIFLTQITMITHLETDILECKVKWARSSGRDQLRPPPSRQMPMPLSMQALPV